MACSDNIPALCVGSLQKILLGEEIDSAIVQIMGYKRVPGSGNERYRLLLNDGETLFPFAILATQLNHLIFERKLEKFTIFKLNKYVCTDIQPTKKVIVCLDIEPMIPGNVINDRLLPTQSFSFDESSCNLTIPKSPNQHHDSLMHVTGNTSQGNVSQLSSMSKMFPDNKSAVKSLNFGTESYLSGSSPRKDNIQTRNKVGRHSNGSITNQNCNTKVFLNLLPISDNAKSNTVPIISLTPYSSKWTIKARVTYKSSVVPYNNAKGSGQYISFYLLDDTGEIRATAFNNLASMLNMFLEINKVYFISGGNIKPSKSNSPIKNEFEITVSDNTKLELTDEPSIPTANFNFTSIRQIKQLPKDSFVDVLGICVYAYDVKTINKAEKELFKRDLLLLDFDKSPIMLTLWGTDAQEYQAPDNAAIAVRNAKVTDFHGCSLSMTYSSMLFIDPENDEASLLKSWFENLGNALEINYMPANSFNETWRSFAELYDIDFEDSDRTEYYITKATIIMVQKEKSLYKACPTTDCYKKLSGGENCIYFCTKCNKECNTYVWTMLLNVNLADSSGSHWAVAFREVSEMLVGYKSEALGKLQEENEDEFLEVLDKLNFQSFVFKLRSKMEVYNETKRLKTVIIDAKPINPVSCTKKLLNDIKSMERILCHD